jgi:hypothetical protein
MLIKKVTAILTGLFVIAALCIGIGKLRAYFSPQDVNTLSQFTGVAMACIIVLIMPYKILRVIWALLLLLISYQFIQDILHMTKPTYGEYILFILAVGCALYAMYDEFVRKRTTKL